MRTLAAALALVLGAAALSACGESTLEDQKVERFVRGVVAEQVRARVATVTCPADVEIKRGATFTCTVTGADGSKGDVRVTQPSDDGSVEVNAPFLYVREAERVMAEQIEKRMEADDVQVACPEIVVVRKRATFRCKATSAGRTRDVSAWLTDGEGRFRYRLSQRPARA